MDESVTQVHSSRQKSSGSQAEPPYAQVITYDSAQSDSDSTRLLGSLKPSCGNTTFDQDQAEYLVKQNISQWLNINSDTK